MLIHLVDQHTTLMGISCIPGPVRCGTIRFNEGKGVGLLMTVYELDRRGVAGVGGITRADEGWGVA